MSLELCGVKLVFVKLWIYAIYVQSGAAGFNTGRGEKVSKLNSGEGPAEFSASANAMYCLKLETN